MNRSRTLPSVKNSAETGGRGARTRPSTKAAAAAASRSAASARRPRTLRAARTRIHAAISPAVHGRGSTAAHGSAAARTQVRSKSQRPAPAALAARGAAAGSHASAAHSAKPPASSGPESGTRITLANGPTSEARPNTASHRGHRAAATAALTRNKVAAFRARPGHASGGASSAAPPAQMIAAHAPTLITALGDSADAGSQASMTAAAKVSAADAVLSRPSARPASAAHSMTRARTQGGSAPVIKV